MGSGVSVVLVSSDKFCIAPRFEYFSTQTIVLIVSDMNQRSLSRSTIGAVKLNLKPFFSSNHGSTTQTIDCTNHNAKHTLVAGIKRGKTNAHH